MAIAASLARFSAESRFDPNALNPGDGADGSDSIGINQWNSTRAKNLERFARKLGKPVNDVAVQALFYAREVKGDFGRKESKWGKLLLNAQTPEDAAKGAISLARPRGWTPSNPERGLGFKEQLHATRQFASGNFDAGIAGKGKTLTGAQAAEYSPADDRGLMQGSKSRGRSAEEGDTVYEPINLDALSQSITGEPQTPIDTSPEARLKNILTGLFGSMAGDGKGKTEEEYKATPQLAYDILGSSTKRSPGVSSILGTIQSMVG